MVGATNVENQSMASGSDRAVGEVMHTMDEDPPEHPTIHSTSVQVTLHYPHGRTERGYKCGWNGWTYWHEASGLPILCDDDLVEPIGWTLDPA